jgi:predicted Zn-dependent protease
MPAMRTALVLPAAIIVLAGVLAACARVEGTNRAQLLLTSAAEENRMGAEAYAQIKAEEQPCRDPAAVAFVERVGRRLAAVAPNKGFTYEFSVFDSPTVNAFCLPGGKVAVYTGLLAYAENEAGLAAVVGHEIAHAIARHGGERMSLQQAQQVFGGAVQAALTAADASPTATNTTMLLFGAGAQFGAILPYSRAHELEADRLGLEYMARAGYDPQEAVAFWRRFATLGGGGPSFLSTHPASDDRAAALGAQQPTALALYHAAPVRYGAGEPVPVAYLTKPVK